MPDLDSLRCFVAAATHPTFKAAAKQVARSPGAFSDRIKSLERELQVQLFNRSTRRVSLTPAGVALLPQARRTLQEAQRCELVVRGGKMPLTLTLATRFELGMSWLLASLDSLETERPERMIHLYFGDTTDLLSALVHGRSDAVVGSMRLSIPRLRYALLHEEHYQLVAQPELLRRVPLKSPKDAQHHTLIDAAPDLPLYRYWADGVPAQSRWSFGRLSFMGTIAAVRARVLAGKGVAVLPAYFVRAQLAAGELVVVAPELCARSDWFRLIWREDHAQQEELLALAQALRARPLC